MTSVRALVLAAFALLLSGQSLFAQDLSRYRDFALGSNLAAVTSANSAVAADATTLHERPAKIQEFVWRAPYVRTGRELADPVHDVVFGFYNDQLYQVVVTYDRERTEGLTNDDVVELLSKTYGLPALAYPRPVLSAPAANVPSGAVVVARWETAESSLTLLRGTYSFEYQLVLMSTPLATQARNAIAEAITLNAAEAPQRETARRDKEVADGRAALDKARVANKAAFRP